MFSKFVFNVTLSFVHFVYCVVYVAYTNKHYRDHYLKQCNLTVYDNCGINIKLTFIKEKSNTIGIKY